jgi:hypothetical protein
MAKFFHIHIKGSHKGRLHRLTHTPEGQDIPKSKELWFKKHGTKAQKKEATFALNARKWRHR